MSGTTMPMPGGPATGGMMGGGDPSAGAAGDAGGDSDSDVIVTICKSGDGSYLVYAGDEPEEGSDGGDTSGDDADAMGAAGAALAPPGGGMPSPQGQAADSVGAALKIAMDILQSDAEGTPGSADDQFAAGFNGSQSPTPATGPAQKY